MLEKGRSYDIETIDVDSFYHHDAFKAHMAEQNIELLSSVNEDAESDFVLRIDDNGWATTGGYSTYKKRFFIPDSMFKRFARHSVVDFEDDVKSISFFIVLRNERLELDKVVISLRDIEF